MAELVSLLDFGSNAVRFVLARVKPKAGFRVLHEERSQTRLGGGRPGTLPQAAVDDTLRAVRRFLREVRRYAAKSDEAGPPGSSRSPRPPSATPTIASGSSGRSAASTESRCGS